MNVLYVLLSHACLRNLAVGRRTMCGSKAISFQFQGPKEKLPPVLELERYLGMPIRLSHKAQQLSQLERYEV